jgi:hypothetical protein
MAEARCAVWWNHTSAVLALIANVNRDPRRRSKPYESSDFHPMTELHPKKQRQEGMEVAHSMAEVKGLLMGTARTLEESRRQAEGGN